MASSLFRDLRWGEILTIILSLALTVFGWGMPLIQTQKPDLKVLNRAVFLFPFFCMILLLSGLFLGVMFGMV
jgi:hypothetical protein